MGALAESMMEFAKPLMDQANGSSSNIQLALDISRHCWNIAVSPRDEHADIKEELVELLGLNEVEFEDFERTILVPMVRRHEEMFPELHVELRAKRGRSEVSTDKGSESMLAYAKPLIENADQTTEGRNTALAMAQDCWNIAILSPEDQPKAIEEVGLTMGVSDGSFEDFRSFVLPMMILRHKAMFPEFHRRKKTPFATTDRYAPCPCGSGKKYKFCCGGPSRK